MSRYIDADKLKENICKRVNNPAIRVWLNRLIDDTPTADVEEVVHSEWHTNTVRMNSITITCRNCHRTEEISITNYFECCPHCGAKMDGKRKDENDDR